MQKEPLSWEAKRIGDKRCSPACGAGCTQASYERAVRVAKGLAARLGPGWTWHVWENLGWHANAVSSDKTCKVHVHPPRARGHRTTYTAFLGDPDSIGGRWAESGRTPEEAVRHVRAAALQEILPLCEILGLVVKEPTDA